MPDLIMPKMGDAMEEGTVLKWLKKPGDPVSEGEPIAEIQTEKSTIEIESFYTGVLKEILVPEGQTVPVGTPIARIVAEGEGALETSPSSVEVPRSEAFRREVGVSRSPRLPAVPPEERIKASPLARRIAAEYRIDLARIHGTGPGGRIIEADVLDYLKQRKAEEVSPAPPAEERPLVTPLPGVLPTEEYEDRELSAIRRTIARRMSASKQQTPHFYITTEVDMKSAIDLRSSLNSLGEDRPQVSFTDMIVKASALALQKFPQVNSAYTEDRIRYYKTIHIGIAVALEEGLVVPVLRHCEKRSLLQIAGESRSLIERARAGKLKPKEYTGATFTISNLGMFDVEHFSAIINPPEAAILAVGSIREKVVPYEGQIAIRPRMTLTLSADHRVLDGATAARFLQYLKKYLEQPLFLLE